MSRRNDIEGYTVAVFVPVREAASAWMQDKQTPEQALRVANEIKEAIKRHLSHDFGAYWERTIDIEPQINAVCDSCGATWTEKDDAYNGGCCDADERDEEERRADNGQFGVGA